MRRLREETRALGMELGRAWSARRRDPAALPELAARALEGRRLHELARTEELSAWVLSAPRLPRQWVLHGEFGQPALTLYWGQGLVIDALFWLNPQTSVHDHSFCGAFTVLRGRSLHCRYAFEPAEWAPGRGLAFGRRRLLGAEFLETGSVTAIPHGAALIHSVWHLRRPSLSLLVRSQEGFAPQHEYHGSGVAVAAAQVNSELLLNPVMVKRLGLLAHLARVDAGGCGRYAAESILRSDPLQAHLTLKRLFECTARPGPRRPAARALRALLGRARAGALLEGADAAAAVAVFPWDSVRDERERLAVALAFSPGAGRRLAGAPR